LKSRITRRDLLRAAPLLAPAAWPRLLQAAAPPAAPAPPIYQYAFVGTYTPNGGGIYLFRLDPATAALTQLQVIDDIRNPTWLALNSAQTRLYAVSEIDNYQGMHSGAIVSYAIDTESLQIKRIGAVSSGGATPAHLSVHPSGKFVFAANYGGGNAAVFPVGPDGALSEATDIRPSVGARHHVREANDPPGQFALSDHDGPHLHMVAADPSGQFVIANDAGLDLTLIWRLDAAAGKLLPAEVPVVPAPPGSAPRHFVFHPNGHVFYNLYEHDAKVAVYDYDAARGGMKLKQVVQSLPPKFAGSNLASEIIMTADGRFLYVANRLHNAVAIFGAAPDGQLRAIGETWVHADSPRSLSIDPSGGYLYSCNQRGDSITSFHLNPLTGGLTFTGRFEAVGSPAVMTILRRP
jgi:6-phosphogluconolactonase (cycloisomerase 2 family)